MKTKRKDRSLIALMAVGFFLLIFVSAFGLQVLSCNENSALSKKDYSKTESGLPFEQKENEGEDSNEEKSEKNHPYLFTGPVLEIFEKDINDNSTCLYRFRLNFKSIPHTPRYLAQRTLLI